MGLPSAGEVSRSLFGAWQLARADETGLNWFDTSVGGFWRSFFAAAIIAPFYLILVTMRYSAGMIDPEPVRYFTVEAIAYVIAWTAFPVVMLTVARILEREDRFLRYIVAYNWAAVLQNAVYMPLGFLRLAGILPSDAAAFLSLVVLGLILMYTWFITKTAMDVPGGTAAGIVALDFVLSLFINSYTDTVAMQ